MQRSYILGGMKRQPNNFWSMRTLPGDREAIATLAQREGMSAAEAVRAAIRRALQEYDRAPAKTEALSISRSS